MSTQPDEINNEPVAAPPRNIELELAEAELEKLRLEIANLQPKRKWHEGITPYIPLITAVLSIAGFLWGVVLFLNQQERDRQTREEERISRDLTQYRSSYEQLHQFAANPNISVQRVLFLRDDIDNLIDSLYPPNDASTQDKNRTEKARLRANLRGLITQSDFTQTRHVQLDIAALQAWRDYQSDIKENPNRTFIQKYIHAIRFLHARDPKYIESVTYDREVGYKEFQPPSDPLSIAFGSLAEGFKLHLELLGPDERAKAIEAFAQVTNNLTLTADLFGSEESDLFQAKK